jgi:hypothetical protein
MSEEEVLNFKANDKELKLFEQEKMDLYKGTFVVCLVYGLSAVLLLALILFTENGREYIYDKFAPAVITYVLGSLIIIIYLLYSIYSIKPRKIGKDIDGDNNIKCPDFWKLKKTEGITKTAMIDNNKATPIITDINNITNANIQYYCEYDEDVYGDKKSFLEMKQKIGKQPTVATFKSGFNTMTNARNQSLSSTQKTVIPDYIIKLPDYDAKPESVELKNYAKFTGAYSSNYYKLNNEDFTSIPKIAHTGYVTASGVSDKAVIVPDTVSASLYNSYNTNAPLVCNKVFPQVLGVLDKKQKNGNEISCEYAKQCDISWSSLNCK